jgi:hypothetical protein
VIEKTIVCPFCGEADFDKIGLKGHLVSDCEEYSKTEYPHSLFADSLLLEAARYGQEIKG